MRAIAPSSAPRADRSRRLPAIAAVAFLCLLSFAWYRGCLLSFFFLDDFWVMRDAAKIVPGELSGFFRLGHAGFQLYRPLTTVAYFYVLRWLFEYDASGYHAVQLVIFTLNSVLVFAIARRLTGSLAAALAVAILYLLAPGQGVGVYWLAAFTVTGTASVVLLMLWCWMTTPTPWRMWLSAALQAVGLLASEHAVVAPPLLAIVTAYTEPRARWRRSALDLMPAALLVGAYGAGKLWYFTRVRPPFAGYALGFDLGTWCQHLGQYAIACCNAVTLLAPTETVCAVVGGGLVALWLVALWLSLRRNGAWSLLTTGLSVFVVSLAPVFPLRVHYKDHYIALAALGMGLAVVAGCELATRHWRGLAVFAAVAVLLLDLVTGGRAWRRNPTFHLVAAGSVYAADWVDTVRQAVRVGGPRQTVFVPRNPVTGSVFGIGQVQAYFPSLAAEVVLFEPGRPPRAAPKGILLQKVVSLPPGAPLPGWDARWAILRRLAGSG